MGLNQGYPAKLTRNNRELQRCCKCIQSSYLWKIKRAIYRIFGNQTV